MRGFKIGLPVALATFFVGVYVTYILVTEYGFISLIPLAMISYVAVLLYLNAKVKPGDNGSYASASQKSFPSHCAPMKVVASGLGLAFVGVLLLTLLFVGLIVLSGGFPQ
jgi:hypothetical protein